jgi:hypothetical protein
MLTLFFWIGASIAVGMAAHNYRNRDGVGWFFLSLIISPVLAGLFLLVSKSKVRIEFTYGNYGNRSAGSGVNPVPEQKDPFTDLATLAMIEATPDGSRSRQLLAEHEATRAAEAISRQVLAEERARRTKNQDNLICGVALSAFAALITLLLSASLALSAFVALITLFVWGFITRAEGPPRCWRTFSEGTSRRVIENIAAPQERGR